MSQWAILDRIMDRKCTHLDQIQKEFSPSDVCEACVAQGDTWVHLRQCLVCGQVGCCDDSKNQHASQHFQATQHAVIRSLNSADPWRYCYVDAMYLEMDGETAVSTPIPDAAHKVIHNYLTIAGLYTLSASLIWGVNTLFLLDAGLSLFEVFLANSIFTGSMALFEIPTGVLADTRGRRASFLLSVVIVLLGTLGYVAAASMGGSLLLFGLMSVVLGLGYTFYSGATEAWLVDALQATGYKGKLDQIFARSSMVSGAAHANWFCWGQCCWVI